MRLVNNQRIMTMVSSILFLLLLSTIIANPRLAKIILGVAPLIKLFKPIARASIKHGGAPTLPKDTQTDGQGGSGWMAGCNAEERDGWRSDTTYIRAVTVIFMTATKS